MLPPKDPAAHDHTGEMKDLAGKKGDDFDKAFLEMAIEMHEDLINDVKKQLLPSATNPELRAMIERGVPVTQGHLDRLHSAKRQLASQ